MKIPSAVQLQEAAPPVITKMTKAQKARIAAGLVLLVPITTSTQLNEGLQNLVAGGVAGIVSRTATAPMDRIKVVLQAGGYAQHHHLAPPLSGATVSATAATGGVVDGASKSLAQNSRIWRTAKMLYMEGGALGFFKGNAANIMKVTPETALKFYANHFFMDALEKDPSKITPLHRFAAGATAGLVAQCTVYPLEVVKTRMALARPGQYRSIFHCLKNTAQTEGIAKMYRGLAPSLLGIVPYAGVELATFNTLKVWHSNKNNGQKPPVYLLISFGGFSSIVAQAVAYPLQLVRTKLQAQGMPGRPIIYSGMGDCFSKIIKEHGFWGLYRGIVPGSIKTVPAIGISYATFEVVKGYMGDRTNDEKVRREKRRWDDVKKQ